MMCVWVLLCGHISGKSTGPGFPPRRRRGGAGPPAVHQAAQAGRPKKRGAGLPARPRAGCWVLRFGRRMTSQTDHEQAGGVRSAVTFSSTSSNFIFLFVAHLFLPKIVFNTFQVSFGLPCLSFSSCLKNSFLAALNTPVSVFQYLLNLFL